MFSEILICPDCQKQFEFNPADQTGKKLLCPHCSSSRKREDYSSVIYCQVCRTLSAVRLQDSDDGKLRCPHCSTAAGTDGTCSGDDTTAGQLLTNDSFFDKYRIISLTGRGGMSEVYKAEHLLLQRVYALKIMKPFSDSSGNGYKRFLREAQCFHQLRHKNIIQVYDIGCDLKTGYLFIAMEYITGTTLASEIGKFNTGELLDLASDMAKALIELEKHKVVHRDIKPSNIMRNSDGVYQLMDLGIAKTDAVRCSDSTLTVDHAIFGTPAYASPEQCQSPHSADHRSDIYSLGVTLYELASGVLPYNGKTAVETVVQVIQSTPLPLSKAAPDLPKPLVELIECMMDKSPERRPQNAEILLTMINTIRQTPQITAPSSRKKVFIATAAAALLLFAAAGMYLINQSPANIKKTVPPEPQKQVKKTTPVPAVRRGPDGRRCQAVIAPREKILELAQQSRLQPDTAGWKQPPFPGWQCHFGLAAEEAFSTGKKLLIFTYRSRFFPKFMMHNKFAQFLQKNFVLLFLDCDLDNMPAAQHRHNQQLRTLLGTSHYWPNTVVLASDGSHTVTISSFHNHRAKTYGFLLNEILQGRQVHFDSQSRYIKQK